LSAQVEPNFTSVPETKVTPSSVANVKGNAVIPKHNHAVVDLMTKMQTKSLIAQNLGNMELSAS
jgi:hypothetical protein